VADRRSPPTDPVARVAWVRACLESAGCFTLLDELPQPATDTEIARAEARLGRTLPEGLRALYRVGVSLYWDVRDDGPSALVEVDVAGQLELIPIDDLAIEDHRIRFTNDGYGNGFCLGATADGADPVMYWNHGEDEVVPFTHVFPAAGRRSARAVVRRVLCRMGAPRVLHRSRARRRPRARGEAARDRKAPEAARSEGRVALGEAQRAPEAAPRAAG
jgi:hypothetical protein